jgi:hypothetical protein
MADWIVRPGGRIVRFRNRPTLHACRRRRHGRPSVGRGLCYPFNVARRMRRMLDAKWARALNERTDADYSDVELPIARPGL